MNKDILNFKHEDTDDDGMPIGKLTYPDGTPFLKKEVWIRLDQTRGIAKIEKVALEEI